MKRFALLLATTAFVTPAMAADVVYEEPPAPAAVYEAPTPTWTGFYAGLQAGVAFNRDSGAFSSDNSSFVGGSDDGETGFIGGGHVGYDYQINNFIVGAVADLNYIDAQSSTSYTLPTGTGTQTFGAEQDINFVGTVRAKAGVAMDRFAVYATGGLAYADIDNEYSGGNVYLDTANNRAFAVSASTDSDDVGYAVGAGFDVMATQNISFGLEYLYTDLGESNVKVNYANALGNNVGNFTTESNTDLDYHSVMAKASYRFN